MPPRDWLVRIEDMLAAIQQIEEYVRGMALDAFKSDRRTVDAVIRASSRFWARRPGMCRMTFRLSTPAYRGRRSGV